MLGQLAEQRARLFEQHLGDLPAAREAYAAALAAAPLRLDLRESLMRTAARVGRWGEAATALLDAAVPPSNRGSALLPLYQSLAAELGANRAAAEAMEQSLAQAKDLPMEIRRDLELDLARTWLDRNSDPAGADRALGRALALDPDHRPALLMRVELQRAQPDRALFDTLVRLGAETPDNLDFMREAAELALTKLGDDGVAGEALRRLWDQAERLVRLETRASGQHQADAVARYALDQTVSRLAADATPARVQQAVSVLTDAAALPFDAETRRQWLRRAAELTETALGDRPGAIAAWRRLHEAAPDDAASRDALVRLLAAEGRHGEVLSMRLAELGQTRDTGRRLTLRLEIVRLCGLIEEAAGPAQVLGANLDELPGHPESLRELTKVLTARGRDKELGDLLERQARRLEERGRHGSGRGGLGPAGGARGNGARPARLGRRWPGSGWRPWNRPRPRWTPSPG